MASARRLVPAPRATRESGHWSRLAAVARERATEQSRKAMAAPDAEAAALALEQYAHLVGLAESYERRSGG